MAGSRGWCALWRYWTSRPFIFTYNTFARAETAFPQAPGLPELQAMMGPPGYSRLLIPHAVGALPPNTASVYRLEDIRIYSNTPIARFRTMIESRKTVPWRETLS